MILGRYSTARDLHARADITDALVMDAIHAWLNSFAAAVRNVDYVSGRALFSDDTIAFGTVTSRAAGIDELVQNQWKKVWPVTRGFSFEPSSIKIGHSGDLAWAVAGWSSFGMRNGAEFQRVGRASFIFNRTSTRIWLAMHSHFSFNPMPPVGSTSTQPAVGT